MGNEQLVVQTKIKMKTFDDGLLTIYQIVNKAKKGDKPKLVLKEHSKHYFGFETIGYNRYYAAKQATVQIDSMVRIWQDRTIHSKNNTTYICIIDDSNEQYKVTLVQHVEEDGLGITRLTLERFDEEYELDS